LGLVDGIITVYDLPLQLQPYGGTSTSTAASATFPPAMGGISGPISGGATASTASTANVQLICQIPESKGCAAFAIHERSSTLVMANKKKLSVYSWQVCTTDRMRGLLIVA
jgi:hypothetical protein